jgi:hypothetical protein
MKTKKITSVSANSYNVSVEFTNGTAKNDNICVDDGAKTSLINPDQTFEQMMFENKETDQYSRKLFQDLMKFHRERGKTLGS